MTSPPPSDPAPGPAVPASRRGAWWRHVIEALAGWRRPAEAPTESVPDRAPAAPGPPAAQAAAVEADLLADIGASLFQVSMDGVLVVDLDARVVRVNGAVERIFGYAAAELVGRPVEDLVPRHGDQEGSVSTFRRTGHDDVLGIEWQVEGVHRDGKRFPLELTDTVVTLPSARTVHVYQVRDISERRRHEEKLRRVNEVLSQLRDQALEASRAKSAFLANMSHELRTPLNAILGYSEMLREEIEERGHPDLVPDLQKIHAAGRHLLALINSILDLSKIEAGKMELFMETIEVRRVVADVEELVRPLADRAHNDLVIRCGPDVGRLVADLTKLRQVLLNLMSNACKFTEGGTVSLVVERYQRVDTDWISFRISDTGIGMSSEQVGKLFQDFSQADASTTRRYGGTGLGLAISRRFIHMMGGEIAVDSRQGDGTTFTLRMPANTLSARPGGTPVPPPRPGVSRVLVIDDDPGVRELLVRTLVKEGFNVSTAASGEQGVAIAREYRPHVITLDVMMPGMDGWAVLAALKGDPALAHVPVVMVSMLDERRVGYALGAAAYLTKPIDRRRLVEVLRGVHRGQEPYHLLMVEDDPAVRDLVRRTLQTEGWRIEEAHDGYQALEAVARERPTAILLDLMMPEMDGFQFLAELDATERFRDIPVIVVTAMDLTREQRERLGLRVERILQKGVYTRDELIEIVRAKVNAHALEVARSLVDAGDARGP